MTAPRIAASGLMAWEGTENKKSNTRGSEEPRGLEPFSVGLKGPRSLKDLGSLL